MNIESIQKKSGIVGRSDAIQQVLEMVAQVAPIEISVLITGDSGTCLLYTSPSPRDRTRSRMPSSA